MRSDGVRRTIKHATSLEHRGGMHTPPLLLWTDIYPPLLYLVLFHSRIIAACSALAYLSAICIYLMGLSPATTLAAVLFTAPDAFSIACAFNPALIPSLFARDEAASARRRPYRLEGLVVRVLKQAPSIVVAVFVDKMLREIFAVISGTALEVGPDGFTFGGLARWLVDVGSALLVTGSLPIRCAPMLPFVCLFLVGKGPRPSSSPAKLEDAEPVSETRTDGIVVVGGGVGGLVLGACLQQLGLPFQVYTGD